MTAPLLYLVIPMQEILVEKVSLSDMKQQDCLLTRWLPITNTLFLIDTIYSNIFRPNYLRNEKYYLNSFLRFLNLDSIFKIFEWKVTLIADVFFNLRTLKDVVRYMPKKSRFTGPFHNWHGKWAETLLKSELQHFYHIYWSVWR